MGYKEIVRSAPVEVVPAGYSLALGYANLDAFVLAQPSYRATDNAFENWVPSFNQPDYPTFDKYSTF